MSATSALYGTMALSSIGSLGTAYSQASALKAAGKYKTSIAQTNAKLADLAEEQTVEAGDINASRKNLETNQKVGAIQASQGASGINVGSGSNALVRSATSGVGAMDEMTIRNNAARAAFGYKVQAIQDKSDISGLTAKAEANQTFLTGGLQAIEGPLSIYGTYKRFSRYMGGGTGNKAPDSYVPTDVPSK